MPHPVFTDELIDRALRRDRVLPRHKVEPERWFHSPVLEALFRAPWWSPYAIYLPALAVLATGLDLAQPVLAPLGFAVGWLTWTLIEYGLHRFIFHWPAMQEAGRVVTYILHRHHHRAPSGADRLVATPFQSASLIMPLGWIGEHVPAGRWATVGLIVGYLLYEAVHRFIHHGDETSVTLRELRRHHYNHHFADPKSNFGISTSLWDHVFGTWRRTPGRKVDTPAQEISLDRL